MKIIFAGTGGFAVPILERLIKQCPQEIIGVITQPDRKKGRGLKESYSPVKELARKYNLPLYQPLSINDTDFKNLLENLTPELGVVVAYGQKLSASILSIPKHGWINIHPSLLPKYRGAAPINYALWNGDTKTGVTIFRLEEKMDSGPIISQKEVVIDEEETAVELEYKLAQIGAELLMETLSKLERHQVNFIPQDESSVSYAPRLKKEDGLINWNLSAERIKNHIRAMQPWPGAYTFYKSLKQGNLKIEIIKAICKDFSLASKELTTPGEVLEISSEGITVATGAGYLIIKELKPANKKVMSAVAFCNGYRIKKGDFFGLDR